jgi:hypothetical protein
MWLLKFKPSCFMYHVLYLQAVTAMRLTNTLCKQSLTFLWKKLYEARGKLKEPTLVVPQFVKDRGIF